MKYIFFVCVVTLLKSVANSKTLPELPKPCHKSDTNISACYLNAFNKLKPFVATGFREFKIPSLDPLEEDVLTVNQEVNQLLSIDMVANNIKLDGLSQFVLDNVKVDTEKLAIVIDASFPHLTVKADFNISAKLGNIPINLQGVLEGDFTDATLNLAIRFKRIQKEGVEHFAVDSFKPIVTIDHGHGKLTAKNAQDGALADLLTRSFNENDKTYLEVTNPFITNIVGGVLRSRTDQAFAQVPVTRFLIE